MKSYSQIQQELILERAKLEKMTSTVKQLGTKLNDANKNAENLGAELAYYKCSYKKMYDCISAMILTTDEAHNRALHDNFMLDLKSKI